MSLRPMFHPSTQSRLLEMTEGLAGEKALPGVSSIGAGYDVFGNYGSPDGITFQLFDWADTQKVKRKDVLFKPGYWIPEVVDAIANDQFLYLEISGKTIDSYQKQLNSYTKIEGSFNYFSGSLSAEFDDSSTRKAINEFTRTQESICKWDLKLLPSESLRDCLKDDVKAALDTWELTDDNMRALFKRYGSHFLTGIVIGGRAVYSSAVNQVAVDQTYSAEVVASASYKSLTGQLSAEEKIKYKEALASFQANSDSRITVYGGDAELAHQITVGKFDDWVASVGESPDFVDFTESNALTPIWELCADESRKNALQTFFSQKYAPGISQSLQIYPNYIDALAVVYGDNSEVKAPSGYTKIPFDTNKGAHGKYIYICYHEEEFAPGCLQVNAVTDLDVIYDDAPAPAGFTKIDIDLNKGISGSAFVYLCYKQENVESVKTIKGITVIGGANPDIPAPYGYVKIAKDLNKEAHGDFIYVCYSKEV